MANQQIEDLGALTALADDDELIVNDKSDVTDDAGGSVKKITAANTKLYMQGVTSEVSITGATTLTSDALSSSFGVLKWHVCSGTSADYTVDLPAVSGNAGKYLAIRMSAALTKLVTLDASGAELIDGSTTRVMWSQESAILFCDGSAWTKVAGKTRPMQCTMHLAASQTGIVTSTITKVLIDTVDSDNTGLMADTTNKRINIKRVNTYIVVGSVPINLGAASTRNITQLRKNAVQIAFSEGDAANGTFPATPCISMLAWAVGDNVEVAGFHTKGTNAIFTGGALSDGASQLNVLESPTW